MRRRSYAATQRNRALRGFVADNAKGMILAGVCFVTVAAVAVACVWLILPASAALFVAGVIVGGTIVGTVGVFAVMWVLSGRGTTWMQGELGESLTRDELRSAQRAGIIHGWVDNIQLDKRDIDHIVVGPFGIVTIETKYKTRPPTVDQLRSNANQAAAAGRTTQAIVRSTHVAQPTQVAAIVVLWGNTNTATDVIDGFGAPIVSGGTLIQWLSRLPHVTDSATQRELLDKLTGFQQNH